MLSRIWDSTKPDEFELAGDGDDFIRELKEDIKERLELDHHMGNVLDPLEGDCEGYHKKVTLKVLADDPDVVANTGILYTKLVDSSIELFFLDSATGLVNQLTENGVLALNPLKVTDFNTVLYVGRNITKVMTVKYPCILHVPSPGGAAVTKVAMLLPGVYQLRVASSKIYTTYSTVINISQYGTTLYEGALYGGATILDSGISSETGYVNFTLKLREVSFYNGSAVSDVVELTDVV